jgi:thioredoxin 1
MTRTVWMFALLGCLSAWLPLLAGARGGAAAPGAATTSSAAAPSTAMGAAGCGGAGATTAGCSDPAAAGAPAAAAAPAGVAPMRFSARTAAPQVAQAGVAAEPKVLVGPVTRDQAEAAAPAFVKAGLDAMPDLAAARALTTVAPGAEVTVYFGTWCSDSQRELSRLWRAFDEIGVTAEGGASGGLPFSVRYIAVDEEKKEPLALTTAVGLKYVPTLIVSRDGHEVGRIVEKSPHGVERDLLALLSGKASGLAGASPRTAGEGAGAAPPRPPRPLR